MDCREYKEIIAAHVDDALSPNEALAAKAHLGQCPNCAEMFLWETKVKDAFKKRLSLLPARAGLREKVLDQLAGTRRKSSFSWLYARPALAAAFAVLLVAALPYLFWQGGVEDEILANAIAQYQKVAQGTADLSGEGSVAAPPARLLDLSPWGYRVLAKTGQEAQGTKGRVFVYQGPESDYLLAQEFESLDISPPRGAKVIRAASREFISYSEGGVNLIAFKEKDLLCILTSTLPNEKLLGLAQQIVRAN